MHKVRKDAVRLAVASRKWRLALTILVMPRGWSLASGESVESLLTDEDYAVMDDEEKGAT